MQDKILAASFSLLPNHKDIFKMDGAWVYLVTGGCGFVGERIVELLSRQDYIKEVRVFDSVAREEIEKLSTGKKRASASI